MISYYWFNFALTLLLSLHHLLLIFIFYFLDLSLVFGKNAIYLFFTSFFNIFKYIFRLNIISDKLSLFFIDLLKVKQELLIFLDQLLILF